MTGSGESEWASSWLAWRARLGPGVASWVRTLWPGCFALVMATGVVSSGLDSNGWAFASTVLLGLGVIAFLILLAATAWRIARYPQEITADVLDPGRSFAFFTFVVAADVLAAQLATDHHPVPATVLLTTGSAAWLVLGYVLPLALIVRHGLRPALASADGAWFLWVVGAQSIVVALTALPDVYRALLGPIAVAVWSIGVVLYLAVAVLVLARLFGYPVRAGQLTPSYWILMGATAISALAGARVLRWSSVPLINATTPVVAGLSVMLWAFGTWMVPVLVVQSVWWERTRLPLFYEPGLWSIVFPVGMYGVASHELGTVLGVRWLADLGSTEIWAGAVVWLTVFVAMLTATGRRVVEALRAR